MKGKILFFVIFLFCIVFYSSNFAKETCKTPKTANIQFFSKTEKNDYENECNLNKNSVVKKANKIERQYGKRIKKYASIHEINPKVVKAIMIVESEGNKNAFYKGAMGLMQLEPKTAEMLNVKNPYDPDENIYGGTKYLKILIERFGDDINVVLVAYNAGPTKVEKRLQEGQNNFDNYAYVKKVKKILNLI